MKLNELKKIVKESVKEAIQLILNQEVNQTISEIKTIDSLNFVLAEDISAPFSLPSFPQSAMDGYAVKINKDWGLKKLYF